MHGRSIAWCRDRCRLQGAYRSLLYAVATHADRHYGACSAGTRRLAASAGISTTWVKRLLHELEDMGVLECLEPGAGRRAACYRFTPSLLDDGQLRSGQPTSPQSSSVVGNSQPRGGQLGDPVVGNSPPRSGQLDAGPYRNEEKSIEEKNTEESASSAPSGRALDAGRADARPAFPNPVPNPVPNPLADSETWKAVLALDPDAHRDDGGWNLSDRYGRAWLRDRDAAWWVEQQRRKLDEQTSQERKQVKR